MCAWIADRPGFAAVTWGPEGSDAPVDPRDHVRFDRFEPDTHHAPGLLLVTWGTPAPAGDRPVALGNVARGPSGPLTDDEIQVLFDGPGLRGVLPPFAAVRLGDDGVRVVRDFMGFHQIYRVTGPGWNAVSTSAGVLASMSGGGLDRNGLLLQSLLGWQLGDRTVFWGVRTVSSMSTRLRGGEVREDPDSGPETVARGATEAVHRCADVLREILTQMTDEGDDLSLQLTGGQDSRILLSAVPPERRRSLHAITVGIPGDPDVDIAAAICERYGMRHHVEWFSGIEDLDPAEAFDMCVRAARRVECSANPLAFAALDWVERRLPQGVRISGLGGEVARGFYYLGSSRDVPVTRRRTDRLAKWRMLVNEAVESEAIGDRMWNDAQNFARGEVYRCLSGYGLPWLRATDELYLRERMRRWAGVTDTAVAWDRTVVNPMLDRRFIDEVTALPPEEKYASRFLARLQLELDPDLARMPLDGRPAPVAYIAPRGVQRVRGLVLMARRAQRKAMQRIRRVDRPAAGTEVLADLVTRHIRANPAAVEGVVANGLISEAWLADVVRGDRDPSPGSLAFVVNLVAALDATVDDRSL